MNKQPLNILMVENNPADVRLAQEAFKEGRIPNNLHIVKDGVEAMLFLRLEDPYAQAVRPHLIFLDLNLPRKDGGEVLTEIKSHNDFGRIPVVVLTTSNAQRDIVQSYDLHANCYIVKPTDLDEFIKMILSVEKFWLMTVTLPA